MGYLLGIMTSLVTTMSNFPMKVPHRVSSPLMILALLTISLVGLWGVLLVVNITLIVYLPKTIPLASVGIVILLILLLSLVALVRRLWVLYVEYTKTMIPLGRVQPINCGGEASPYSEMLEEERLTLLLSAYRHCGRNIHK